MPKKNDTLAKAKTGKNDEFYTMYEDIQSEVNAYLEYNPDVFKGKTVLLPCDDPEWSNFTKFFAQNFDKLGLKKLISTSFASDSKKEMYHFDEPYHQFNIFELTDFEKNSPNFDAKKTYSHGKIFVLERNSKKTVGVDINDLQWSYLEGDGDFRSEEVCKLRDEADVIITNPPFSLFKEFIAWIFEADKQCLIIGNQNALTYKEVFKLIKENKLWLGKRFNKRVNGKNMQFQVPNNYPLAGTEYDVTADGKKIISVSGTGWFTNIDHGRRHNPYPLMTMEENKKYSKHEEILGKEYPKYETFDAIDVAYTDAIPKDYKGIMGVPKTFMTYYCYEQFEILGYEREDENIKVGIKNMPEEFLDNYRKQGGTGHYTKGMKMLCFYDSEGRARIPFSRILIRYTKEWIKSHPEDFK